MSSDTEQPADTRIMGIVHQALRRDLIRTQAALTATPPPSGDTRRAVAGHVVWMMQFLHHHHSGEDEGLYPLVRERSPGAADLLDQMHTDHQHIAPALAGVEAAAGDYLVGGADERQRLLDALELLDATLLPHLLVEEQDVMPVVSATLTEAEWRGWDKTHNIKPKSFAELGFEGHWLIDDLDSEDRDLVTHLVPPVPRVILLKGFARAYRRHAARCWGMPGPRRRRVDKRGRTEALVAADRGATWEVLSDVTRVGEWSHECGGAEWLDGATAAVPGARFRGHSHAGILRWGRVCEIVDASPWSLVWRTVPSLGFPDSTEWRIRLDETEGGLRIEQTFQVLHIPKVLDIAYAILIPAHRDRAAAITEDLRRLGSVAMANALT